ncbi:MAG: elongation factor P [Candidatus Omnitrophica bacterium]|nr:elongation factor P [Candidatus Omnitrophota bacterium]MCB9747689.1 elongation factor P [Candidatus Omnitrophota bacterium]
MSINQIANGIGLQINNDIFIVTDYSHVKPGKGSAFVRVKLKNVKTNQVIERTFKTADKLEDAALEERRMQNLYNAGESTHFMDLTTFEEVVVDNALLGDSIRFLQDHLEVTGLFFNNKVLKIILPNFIIAEVTYTEPGLKGDSISGGTKPATIDSGANVQVPLFINIGDRLKIDTRTGEYVERVKNESKRD